MEYEIITATWIIAIATIFTAVGTIIFHQKQNNRAKEQNETSKKQIEYLALLEIMKIFNNPVNAAQRHRLYSANKRNALYSENGEFQGQDLAVDAGSVLGTFDIMGILVKEGYVNKEQFLNMYVAPVIRVYKLLKRHIENERERRISTHFVVNFEWLFTESKRYWNEKFSGHPEPEPF